MTNKPHILFIMADQLRADSIGVAGHPLIETPNIDLLAKDVNSFSDHKPVKVNFIRIESNLDFKKIRSSNGNSLLSLKRNRYKLMRLLGQSPKFIRAKKSVAE